MEGYKNCLIIALVCLGMLKYLDANCVFPNSLQGRWSGLDDNKLTFTADELTGFKLNIPHLLESDFMCIKSFVEGDTTKYILRAKDSVTIFGVRPALYMCLEIQDDTIIYYAIDTNKNPILQDHVYGTVLSGTPTEQDVCNARNLKGTVLIKLTDIVPRKTSEMGNSLRSLLVRLRQELEDIKAD